MTDDEKKDDRTGDGREPPGGDEPAGPEEAPSADVPAEDDRPDRPGEVPPAGAEPAGDEQAEPSGGEEDGPEDRMDDDVSEDWEAEQGDEDDLTGDGWEEEDWADESYNERDWQNPNWQDENWQDEHYVERQRDYQKPDQEAADQAAGASGSAAAVKTVARGDKDLEEEDDEEDGGPRMSLVEHLEELRKRLFLALLGLVVGMVATVAFGKPIISLLNRPYYTVVAELGMQDNLKAEKPFAGISIYFTVCLVSGLIITSPWVFYQLWRFVAEGLYRRERKYVMRAIPFSTVLFVAGAGFFLLVVSYKIMYYLMWFNRWMELEPIITQKTHVGFMVRMMIVFGLGFQIPLVVLVLTKIGLVSRKAISSFRRYIVVGIFIFAAVSTSPSPVDQLLLALPMWLLFEIGLMLAYFAEKKRLQEDEAFLDS